MTIVTHPQAVLVNASLMLSLVKPREYNLKQRILSRLYDVPLDDFNRDGDLPIKLLYGYILHNLGVMRCFYDCAYAADVTYEGLDACTRMWDDERNLGSCIGRNIDVVLANFKKYAL